MDKVEVALSFITLADDCDAAQGAISHLEHEVGSTNSQVEEAPSLNVLLIDLSVAL